MVNKTVVNLKTVKLNMVRLKIPSMKHVIIFGLGILLGAIAMRGYILFEMYRMFDGGPSGSGVRKMILSKLDGELHLTKEQHLAVESELKQVQKVLKSVEATMQPLLDTQINSSIESLKRSLTPEQIQRLQALQEEFEKKRQKEQAAE